LQIKSGDRWFKEKNGNNIIFRGNNEHLKYWQNHSLPVIVVLYKDSENTAYWQAVNNTVQKTKKGWKLLIPLDRQVNSHALEPLKKLSQKIISAREYTELSLQDVSHDRAKRYAADILLNRELTKDDIIQVIKDVTKLFCIKTGIIINQKSQRSQKYASKKSSKFRASQKASTILKTRRKWRN